MRLRCNYRFFVKKKKVHCKALNCIVVRFIILTQIKNEVTTVQQMHRSYGQGSDTANGYKVTSVSHSSVTHLLRTKGL